MTKYNFEEFTKWLKYEKGLGINPPGFDETFIIQGEELVLVKEDWGKMNHFWDLFQEWKT